MTATPKNPLFFSLFFFTAFIALFVCSNLVSSLENYAFYNYCPAREEIVCDPHYPYRTFDGSCNNLHHPLWNKNFECVTRFLPPDYGDDGSGQYSGRRAKSGQPLPNARDISNFYHAEIEHIVDANHTHILMEWGQFLSEEFTVMAAPRKNREQFPCCTLAIPQPQHCDPIFIPPNDPFYSKFGQTCINKFRSNECYNCKHNPREQTNEETSTIDASTTYGSSIGASIAVRAFSGGKLLQSLDKFGKDGMLPRAYKPVEISTDDNCDPIIDKVCFRVGSGTAQQQPLLATLFTLFYRQHNHVAEALGEVNPHWNDERLFQEARRIVIAQIQMISYSHFLPLVIGDKYMSRGHLKVLPGDSYTEYNPHLNPTLANEFGSAVWRFGHSLINGQLALVDDNWKRIALVPMKRNFFHPKLIYDGNFDNFLRGLIDQPLGGFDPMFVDDIRNHLYQAPNASFGQDLVSLNIKRGRDHGVRGYIDYIEYCDGVNIKAFADLNHYMVPERWKKLAKIYEHPGDIDMYTGELSERPVPGAIVGPTLACLIAIQFERLKFGDRFYFEHHSQAGTFTAKQLKAIKKTTLGGIVCANGDHISKVPLNVFIRSGPKNPLTDCSKHYDIVKDLRLWHEDDHEEEFSSHSTNYEPHLSSFDEGVEKNRVSTTKSIVHLNDLEINEDKKHFPQMGNLPAKWRDVIIHSFSDNHDFFHHYEDPKFKYFDKIPPTSLNWRLDI